MDVRVRAEDAGEEHRVGVVGLLTSGRVTVAIAGDGQRVDRVDLPTRCPQCGHEEAAGCLDRDRDRVFGSVTGLCQHGQELIEALDALGDTTLGDQTAVLVDKCDVVMAFRPVDAPGDLQARSPQRSVFVVVTALGGTTRRTNGKARWPDIRSASVIPATITGPRLHNGLCGPWVMWGCSVPAGSNHGPDPIARRSTRRTRPGTDTTPICVEA